MSKDNGTRYYADIEAVKEVYTPEEANDHIKGGWELLKPIEKHVSTDTGKGIMLHTTIVYVMGLKKGEQRPTPESKPDEDTGRKCFKCDQPVKIQSRGKGQGYDLLNPDGTPHKCGGKR